MLIVPFKLSETGQPDNEEPEFNWEEYLQQTGSTAAPPEAFRHVSSKPSPPPSYPPALPLTYNWEEYLQQTGSTAAPPEAFRHVSSNSSPTPTSILSHLKLFLTFYG